MLASILRTKLYYPPVRAGIVTRPHLIRRLEAGRHRKLTLVSAPAGFGKTTLLSEWLSTSGNPFIWISLDENDNQPAGFLTYLVAALRQLAPGIGSCILSSLNSTKYGPAKPPSETLLTELVNEIGDLLDPFTLVLDDYHTIHEPAIQRILGFLVERQPENMHLVISGRADPPWALGRLRALGEISELRMSDLRFTSTEASAFLNETMHLNLTPHQIETLEACTEGWIAGLQMAAISMQGRSDMSSFIEAFTGSHRFIADFLLEEVLLRQPLATQEFLLKTSILDRICAPLADAVLGASTSGAASCQAVLDTLERSNLFLIPLDDERRWYRYHHLFRDLLRSNLVDKQPVEAPQLQARASQWYATAGLYEEAVGHAFSSQDMEWTASMIEQAACQIDIQNKLVIITAWIDRLPEALVVVRPWLCVYRAWGQYWTGHRDLVESTLAAAEKALEDPGQDNATGSVESETPGLLAEEARHIRGHIAAIRAHSALTGENISRVLEMGEKALALLPAGDEMRCETGVALGGAYWALGDVKRAELAFASGRMDALMSGYSTMAVPASCYVGMMQTKQARIDAAMTTYRDALRLATTPDGKETSVAGFPNTKLGDLLRERNELDLAQAHLSRGVAQCEQLGQADVLTDGFVCLARLQITLGDLSGARASLKKAQAVAATTKIDPFVVCWLDECRIRLWLHEGSLSEALEWARQSGLSPGSPLSYHYDLHHANLARVLVFSAQQPNSLPALHDTLALLDRLLEATTRTGWTYDLVRCLILKALALHIARSRETAIASLAEALRLAAPAGLVRTFLDEGDPMRSLLEGVCHTSNLDPRLAEYASGLLATQSGARPSTPLRTGTNDRQPALVEPLSEREMEVLRLLNAGLTGGEIASELFLSVHTVRTHIKHIYGKLDANRRIEALQRAKDLRLL